MKTSEFRAISDRIDLNGAMVRRSKSNDLLLPRVEDKLGGQLGPAFSASLLRKLERGDYEPEPAVLVTVPKPNLTSRPAALLTFDDRVVFDALVMELRPRIERSLLGAGVAFWPWGSEGASDWSAFEKAPLASDPLYVVRADVAGYYESVSHGLLAEALLRSTGRREIVDALTVLLGRVMRGDRGLPQGLPASDPLATAFLAPVDRVMTMKGFQYYRHGDDFRIAVSSFPQGLEALATLEDVLRQRSLMLSGAKSRVLRVGTYRSQLDVVETEQARFRDSLHERRVEALIEEDDSERVSEMLLEAGLEEMTWQLYHGAVDMYDVAESLGPYLQPSDTEVAVALFSAAANRAPGEPNALRREVFHGQLNAALTILTAAREGSVIERCGWLLTRYPDETHPIGNYLLAVAGDRPREVAVEVDAALRRSGFRHGWQDAWLFRIAASVADSLSESLYDEIVAPAANDERRDWYSRVGAASLLGVGRRLKADLAVALWNLAPRVFQPEILAAVARMYDDAEWTQSFLSSAAGEPLFDAILQQLGVHPRAT